MIRTNQMQITYYTRSTYKRNMMMYIVTSNYASFLFTLAKHVHIKLITHKKQTGKAMIRVYKLVMKAYSDNINSQGVTNKCFSSRKY